MMNNNFNNNGTNNNGNNNSNNGGKFIMANNTINSLEVFADVIKEAFSVTYPDAMVRVHEVKKNNGMILTGLAICDKGTNLAPTIYLDGFFEQYRMGRTVADIIKEIDDVYRQHRVDVRFDESSVLDLERVQDKICYILVNKDRNKELLADAPHVDVFDLAVAGDVYPKNLVKSKFLKLNYSHVEYVINCLGKNTTKVRNIKSYLLASLFNAGSTISSYYRAEVNHDMPQYAG